jgi:hypothetical protein
MKFFILLALLTICISSSAKAEQTPLAAFRIDSLWYVIDHEGNQLFSPLNFNYINDYSEGFYTVFLKYEGKPRWAFMNDEGNIAMPDCNVIRNFSNGRAMLIHILDTSNQLSMYGFIDKKGNEVIPSIYLDALNFSEGKAWVMNRNVRGFIDTSGKFLFKFNDETFGYNFSEGFAAVVNENSLFGYVDSTGKVVIDYKFDDAAEFQEGLARVNVLGLWGYVDKQGVIKIPTHYDFAHDFSYGHAFIGRAVDSYEQAVWGVVNTSNIMTVDFQYEDVRNFSEGMGAVRLNGKWRFVNYIGQKLIEREFDAADRFKNGLAWAVDSETNEQGWITPEGKYLIHIPEEADTVIDLRFNKKVK